ncbi:hypothetical protein MUP06_00580 [Patescibacteria group bacterium]|nr:hypothetical protein [Patescibacteria group bacterium]
MEKSFDEELYKNRSINILILFSIYSVIENKEKCTFERLVKECFTLFPKAFSFSKYPQWPDSRKLDRPLRSLRRKRLILGDPKTAFSLTKSGKKIVEEIVKAFRQRKLFK